MTRAEKNKVSAKVEFGLMYNTAIPVQNDEELEFIVEYLLSVLKTSKLCPDSVTAKEVLDEASKYNESGMRTTHVSVFCIESDVTLTFVRGRIDYEDGVCLAYVVNLNCLYFSELGYATYQKTPMGYKRIF